MSGELRAALFEAFDSGREAQGLTVPLTVEPPSYRWWEFWFLFLVAAKSFQRAKATPTSLQYEGAALACRRFHRSLAAVLALFPDGPLRAATRPSDTWEQRLWKADGTAAAEEVRQELAAAMAVVSELVAQLNLGRELKPR